MRPTPTMPNPGVTEKRPPNPLRQNHRRTIDDPPFWVIVVGTFAISVALVGLGAFFVERSARSREREREEQRELCLDRGGIVSESEYGRYLGCKYERVER